MTENNGFVENLFITYRYICKGNIYCIVAQDKLNYH